MCCSSCKEEAAANVPRRIETQLHAFPPPSCVVLRCIVACCAVLRCAVLYRYLVEMWQAS
jgi:hypothetical protein